MRMQLNILRNFTAIKVNHAHQCIPHTLNAIERKCEACVVVDHGNTVTSLSVPQRSFSAGSVQVDGWWGFECDTTMKQLSNQDRIQRSLDKSRTIFVHTMNVNTYPYPKIRNSSTKIRIKMHIQIHDLLYSDLFPEKYKCFPNGLLNIGFQKIASHINFHRLLSTTNDAFDNVTVVHQRP